MAPACFGDLELTARIDPFLTVIAQPAYELWRLVAVAVAVVHVEGDQPALEAVRIANSHVEGVCLSDRQGPVESFLDPSPSST